MFVRLFPANVNKFEGNETKRNERKERKKGTRERGGARNIVGRGKIERKGIKINGERDYNETIRGADIMRYLKLDY